MSDPDHEEEELDCDPLFRGITRPAMWAGTTFEAFIVNVVVSSVVISVMKNGLYLFVVGLPIHLVCVAICRYDERAFEVLFVWIQTKGSCLASAFWKASSYSPLSYIKRKAR